jgi:hypothetical protein
MRTVAANAPPTASGAGTAPPADPASTATHAGTATPADPAATATHQQRKNAA